MMFCKHVHIPSLFDVWGFISNKKTNKLLDFEFHVCMFNFNLVHGRIEIVLQNAVGMNASV